MNKNPSVSPSEERLQAAVFKRVQEILALQTVPLVEVAEATGLDRQTLYRLQGKIFDSRLRLSSLVKFADGLGYEVKVSITPRFPSKPSLGSGRRAK